jgi:predicted RNase H-like HicB family nuclease
MAATYQVELERDERGWWVASVPAVPRAHTQGRSIAQAMNRIREALSLWVTGAEQATLVPAIHLPAAVQATVRRATAVRERAKRAEDEALVVLRDSIRELTQQNSLSTRDVAVLLKLSPARVDQLKRARARKVVRSPQRVRSKAARRTATRTATATKK